MPGANPRDIRAVHAQIRKDIADYRRQLQARQDGVEFERLGASTRPNDMVRKDVNFGCRAVGKLLDDLVVQTKTDDLAEAQLLSDAAAVPDKDDGVEADLLDEATTLRALASDDITHETSSDTDYGSDPPPAPGYSTSSIVIIRDTLHESHQKMCESIDTIASILQSSPHWWTSPMVMRRLKTHFIRVNYYARKFKKWANQCRAHLFVSSSILNRAGNEATADLKELRRQLATYAKRRERLRTKQTRLTEISQNITKTGEEVAQLFEKLAMPVLQRGSLTVQHHAGMASAPSLTIDQAEASLLLGGLRRHFPEVEADFDTLLHFLAEIAEQRTTM